MPRGFSTDYSGTGGGGGFGYARFDVPTAGGGSQQLAEGFGALSRALAQRQTEAERNRRRAIEYWRQNTKHIPQQKLAEFEGAFDAGVDEGTRNSAEHIYARTQHSIKAWNDAKATAKAEQERADAEQKAAEAREKAAAKQAADLRKLTGKGQAEAVAEAARLESERAKYEEKLAKYNAARHKARAAAAAKGELAAFHYPDFVYDEPSEGEKVVPVHDRPEDVGITDAQRYVSIPKTDPRVWLTPEEAQAFVAGEAAQPAAVPAGAPAPQQPAGVAAPVAPAAAGPSAPPPPAAPSEPRDPRQPPYPVPRTPEQIQANYFHSESVKAAEKAVSEAEKDVWSKDAAKQYAEDVFEEYVVWRATNGLPPLEEGLDDQIRKRFEMDAKRYLSGPQRRQVVFADLEEEGQPTFVSQQPFGFTAEERNEIAAQEWLTQAGPYPGLYEEEAPLRERYEAPPAAPTPTDERSFWQRPLFGAGEALGGLLSVEAGDLPPAQELAAQSLPGAVSPETLPPTAEETFGAGFFPGIDQLEATMVRTEEVTPEEQAQFDEIRQHREQLTSLAQHVARQSLAQGKSREEAQADVEEALSRQMANLQQQVATGRTALAQPASQRIALGVSELTTPASAAKIAAQALVMMTVGRALPGAVPAALRAGIGAGVGAGAAGAGEAVLRGEPIDAAELARQAALEGATVGAASKIPLGRLERAVGRVTGGAGAGIARLARGTTRESVQEMAEEALQQIATGDFNPENLVIAAIGGGIYGPAMESVLVGMGVDPDQAAEAAQRQREAVSEVLEGDVLPPDSPEAQRALMVIEGAPPEGAAPGGPAGPAALPPGPTPAGLIAPGTVRTPEGAIVAEPGAEAVAALPAGETELQRLQRETAEAMQRAEAAQALPTRRGPRTAGGLEVAGPEAEIPVGTAPGPEVSPTGALFLGTETTPRGPRGPTVEAATPEGILRPTSLPFAEWVDGAFGEGVFATTLQHFQQTGDRAGLDNLRRAWQLASAKRAGVEAPATRAELQVAQEAAQAAREIASIGRGDPEAMNRLRAEARAAEQAVAAGQALQGPLRTQDVEARVYQTTQGPDGMFYVDSLQDPRVTRREREGGEVEGLGYRQQVVGPFTTREAAEGAADAMQARYDVEGQDMTPAQLQRAERKWATAAWREGTDRGARRQAGRGRPSPAVLAPGVEPAPPTEAPSAPAPPLRPARPRRPSRRGVLPTARQQAGTAGPTVYRSRAEALRAREATREAAKEVDIPAAEMSKQEEGALLDEMRAAADMLGPQGLSEALGITVEEATEYIAAQRVLKGGGTAMGVADPFSAAVGTVQSLLDRRRAQRQATAIERKAAAARRRALRGGEPEGRTKAGTLQQEQEALEWGEDFFNVEGSDIDHMLDSGQYVAQPGEFGEVEIVYDNRSRAKKAETEQGLRDLFDQWIDETPLDDFDERSVLYADEVTPEGRKQIKQALWQQWLDEHRAADTPPEHRRPYAIQSPYFLLTTNDEGVVTHMAMHPEAMSNPRLKLRASMDMMRTMLEAMKHDLRFESLDNISTFSARIYDNIAAMWGGEGADLAGKTISEIVSGNPVLKQTLENFALRERAKSARRRGARATASFMGLDQAWETARQWFPGDAKDYVARVATGPRTTLEHLRDLGPNGQQIAGMQEQYRDIFESMRGRWFSGVQEALDGLGEAERGDLVAWLEDAEKRVSPKVRQRGEKLRTILDEVAALAQQNERFSQYLTDYFPHILSVQPDFQQKARSAAQELWKSPTHKARMRAMGATNWSDNIAADYAAAQLMFPGGRLYGGKNPNLERHRTGFLSEYRKDPEVLYQYLNSAAKAISQAMVYDSPRINPEPGKEQDRYGRWKALWGKLANEPGMDRGLVDGLKRSLERELGIEQPPPSTAGENIAALRDIVASSSLFLSVLAQPGSFADLRASLGSMEIPEAALAGLRQAWSQRAIDTAVRAGSVSPKGLEAATSFAEERALGQQGQRTTQGLLGKAGRLYRRAPWMRAMRAVDSAMRVTADSAARIALPKVVAQVRAGDQTTLQLLRAAGIDPNLVAGISDADAQTASELGSLDANTQQAVDTYARRWTEFTQQRARPGDLPKSWSGPVGQWVSMFMPFTYRQTKNMLKAARANPVGFVRSGLPAYTLIGLGSLSLRAIIAGYGMGGEEDDEMTVADKVLSIFSNRPVKADSPEDLAARIAQTILRVGPKPFGLYMLERFERAKTAEQTIAAAAGPGARYASAIEAAQRGIRQHDRPANISPAEWAARAAATTGAQLALPSTYSYQIQRELMGLPTAYPRKDVPLPPTPGAVGRMLDLMRGEITAEQFLRGVTIGGEEALSERRKKRRRDIKASRKRTPKAAAERAEALSRFK